MTRPPVTSSVMPVIQLVLALNKNSAASTTAAAAPLNSDIAGDHHANDGHSEQRGGDSLPDCDARLHLEVGDAAPPQRAYGQASKTPLDACGYHRTGCADGEH